jgi:hypothetical protein
VRLVPQVNRGVKWAFPRCGALPDGSWVAEHDPESAFPVGHRFFWYEFKSSAQDFAVMYLACFCGEAGPRTIFTILACEGYRIQVFSHLPNEAEVLFRPLSQFEVVAAQKRLAPQHLLQNATKGGFPDEITLQQLPREGGGAAQALGQPPAASAPFPAAVSAGHANGGLGEQAALQAAMAASMAKKAAPPVSSSAVHVLMALYRYRYRVPIE